MQVPTFISQAPFSRRSMETWKHALACMTLTSLMVFSPVQAAESVSLSEQQQISLGLEFGDLKPAETIHSEAYPATLQVPAPHSRLLTAPMDGLVTQIFRVHGSVEKGEAIVELQAAELLKLQKGYLATLSELKVAQREVKRARSLIQSGVVSEKQLLASESRATTLAQQAQQQRQDLSLMGMSDDALQTLTRTLRLQPARLIIHSPQKGELYDLKVSTGMRLTMNQPIARFARLDEMVAGVHVPIALARTLSTGQKVRIVSQKIEGEIAYISHQADAETQTVEVHCRFANANRQLIAGALESVEFVAPVTAKQAYQVPQKSVVEIEGQSVIFLQSAAQTDQIRVQPVDAILQPHQQVAVYFKDGQQMDPGAWRVLTQGSAAMLSVVLAETEGGE